MGCTPRSPREASATVLLTARGLTASRLGDDGPLVVFSAVDLDVDAGTLTDIAGPSGCGKTTLLLTLARLLPGASGELALDGVAASAIDPREWRTRVAYLPQRASLAPGTVAENLLLPWRLSVRKGTEPPSAEELRTALDGVSLGDVALDRSVARLSVGQAARIAALRVLLTRPECLLLDEPDANLDDESASQVACMTDAFVIAGGAVVRVRHARVDERADRRFVMAGGHLMEATAR
jgi:putative ABC transport system ATP-binding protein